jgi:hypothetical protein
VRVNDFIHALDNAFVEQKPTASALGKVDLRIKISQTSLFTVRLMGVVTTILV